ncbi:response regulator [Aeoliella mucimassa]|uniref:Putative transcriptional regulatory protein pdtaR n=1 Tax=Aeoliella mucimassa TaxID=2527972 RepID=A0A518ARJ1_9BACT|nr:response regulator [Aeoliella mucimassa]QDU57326.1 putative transcriptional regulatory protein pdtaR [Aeoliella mucimassa]
MSEKQRVLIVDDEPDIREGASLWLRSAGYDTVAAVNGEQGIEFAETYKPDGILLDVLMPRMDGMQTLSHLRSSLATRNIPVVMLSASLRDEQRALDAGARYFVHKPYDGRSLVSAVKVSIGQAS